MKLSELWLREWVNPEISLEDLAAQLTMAGLEVDGIHPVAGTFDKVIVAEVFSTKPHPKADKLSICEVHTGKETLQIVCGASNVRAGLKVALACIGATLPGDFVIKEATLRGELSQGMLCSFSELGMAYQSEGIMELDKEAPVGKSLREYLSLDDTIIDVDLTPNRSDCLSVQGIARELSVLNDRALQIPSVVDIVPELDDTLPVQVEASAICPRYYGRILKNINQNAETPFWMAERLRRSGLRLLHPVVDICNYLMLERGQPLHAFDLETIKKGITVRHAKDQETCVLLDNQEIKLKTNTLVIADEEKVLAMAGIMGGKSSAVSENTSSIFIESAFFNPETMAGIARSYGLCTDASQRFERGVDPNLPKLALERATALLQSIVGGQAGPIILQESKKSLPQNETIEFNINLVKKLTGVEIPASKIKTILERLGMQVEESTKEWKVKAPSHRFDIKYAVDLVEEIVRIYGYNNIPTIKAQGEIRLGTLNPTEQATQNLSQWFSHRGYHETISYSFIDPQLQAVIYPEAETMDLINPISSELAQMRTGLWPGLIASMIHNVHRQQETVRFFEVGVVFEKKEGQLKESPRIAGLVAGLKGALNWCEKETTYDFYDLKGDLEALFKVNNIASYAFVSKAHPALHPGQSASILVNDKEVGWIGVIHPQVAYALDLSQTVIVFELSLEIFNKEQAVRYKPLSKYPQIRRDLSFLVDEKITASEIEAVVRETLNPQWLKAFSIFDLYTGKGIEPGKKSLAIAIILQNPEKTLIDIEINAEISAIINELEQKFSITLRD